MPKELVTDHPVTFKQLATAITIICLVIGAMATVHAKWFMPSVVVEASSLTRKQISEDLSNFMPRVLLEVRAMVDERVSEARMDADRSYATKVDVQLLQRDLKGLATEASVQDAVRKLTLIEDRLRRLEESAAQGAPK